MSTIKTVGIKRLIRNGLLGHRVVDHGAFGSLEEARQAAADGYFEFSTGDNVVNIIMVLDAVEKMIKFYEWSFPLNDWTAIGQGDSNPVQYANGFIRIAKGETFIGFSNAYTSPVGHILSPLHTWSIYIKFPEIAYTGVDLQGVTLVQNGDNAIKIRLNASSWDIVYTDGTTENYVRQYRAVPANTYLGFTHTANSGMQIFLSGSGFVGTVANTANDTTNGVIKIGEGTVDLPQGGVDNIMFWDTNIGYHGMNDFALAPTIEESVSYESALVHLKCGEDVYPEVLDSKGTLTGGELFNGRPEDFVEIVDPNA